ncbi:hypothetical protein RN001_009426 [Aquatica leii]|uniref:F-box domain-containing protein n=1 Tax=Aquatica leii TaxID=1421715 RepID=A0AAN7Q2G8_9COLE|nr:hypothetical protein RN001_009426 [Aquatica leii]
MFLPVEMLVNILRFLDDKSLLNAAFSNKRFMSVCKGDSVLRRRVRSFIRKEQQLFKKSTLNAKLHVEIIRHNQPQLFGRNQKKVVTVRKIIFPRPSFTEKPTAKYFTISESDNRPSGGGKLRKKCKDRLVPYKMYSLLGYTFSTLIFLPVEMLVNILRFLDDKSLLNAAFSSKRFMSVCKGDPVLRKRVRSYIRKEKQLFKKSTLNAKLQVEITRHDQPRLFGRNQKKVVTVNKLIFPRPSFTEKPTAKYFTVSESDNRPSGGGKLRNKCKDRLVQYKCVFYKDDHKYLSIETSKHFMSVSKRDPVLTRRVKSYIRKEKQLFKKSTLNAKLQVEIIQHDQLQLFGRNQEKVITVKRIIFPRLNFTDKPTAKYFTVLESDNKTSGGGKLRKKCKD